MKLLTTLVLVGSTSCLTLPASAQGVLQRFPQLGDLVAGMGDLDGDGFTEVLVGRSTRPGSPGEVQLVSVVDGNTLRSHATGLANDGFAGAAASLGDVDGDGVGDYAISTTAGASPGVRVHSGSTGLVVRTIVPPAGAGGFGTVLAAGGDVDGDQVNDLLITSSGGTVPTVWVFSFRGGNMLRSHVAASSQEVDYGCALSIVGDLDGDGKDDYAIGNSRAQTTHAGEVQVHSGASGGLRYSLTRPVANDELGTSISPMGDVDGDGRADFVVGAPREWGHVQFRGGMAFVHSGADGRMLTRSSSSHAFDFGFSVLGIEDYDGDGTADFLAFGSAVYIGGVIKNRNSVFVTSGRTGYPIHLVFGVWPMPEYGGGGPVVSAGDLNRDGLEDWLVGGSGFHKWQSTALLRNAPVPQESSYWFRPCQNGKPNSLGCFPTLSWSTASSLSVGAEPRVTATNLVGHSVALMLWGPTRASIPFGSGSLCVGMPLLRTDALSTGGTPGACDGGGMVVFPRSLLLGHGLSAGSELVAQAWCRDPGFAAPLNFNLTGAVAFTLWP